MARIGEGALAEVHLARQQGARLPVAVKAVHPQLTAGPGQAAALLEVARLAAEVKHPNVVDTLEVGEDDGTCFLAMEYLPGASLAAVQKAPARGVRLDRWSLAQIVADAAAGLHAIHELHGATGQPAGLLHLDLDPANVFVLHTGQTKLLGAAIARARPDEAEARVLAGYVAPEVRDGGPGDRRSDVFALGVVMWEALTRSRLYGPGSDRERLARMRIGRVSPPSSVTPDVGKALDDICVRALAKDPAGRYPTAGAMHDDLVLALRAAGRFGDHPSIARFMREAFATEIASREQLLREQGGFDIAASGSIRRPTAPPFRSGSTEPPPFAAPGSPARASGLHAAVDGAGARSDSRIANAFAADLAEAIELAPGEGLPDGDGVPELEADLEESAPHVLPSLAPVAPRPPPMPGRTIMMVAPPAKAPTMPPPMVPFPHPKPATMPPPSPARTIMMTPATPSPSAVAPPPAAPAPAAPAPVAAPPPAAGTSARTLMLVPTPIDARAAAAVATPALEPVPPAAVAPPPAAAAAPPPAAAPPAPTSAPTLMISRTPTPTLTPSMIPSANPSPIASATPTPFTASSPTPPLPTPIPPPTTSAATVMFMAPPTAAAETHPPAGPSPIPITRLASMTGAPPPSTFESGADDAAATTTGPITPITGPHRAAAATPWAPAPFDGEFDEEIEVSYGAEPPEFDEPPPPLPASDLAPRTPTPIPAPIPSAAAAPTSTATPAPGRGLPLALIAITALVLGVVAILWLRGRGGSHADKVATGPRTPGSASPGGSGAPPPPPGPGSAAPMVVVAPDAAPVEPVAAPPDAAEVVAIAPDASEPAVAIDAGVVAPPAIDAGTAVAIAPPPPRPTPPRKPAGPTAATLYKEGQASFMIGNNTTALQYFQSAVAKDPSYALAHRSMGLIYDRMGDRARAAKSYRAYLKLQPRAKDAALIKSRLEKLP